MPLDSATYRGSSPSLPATRPPPAAPQRRAVTIEQILVWAYGDQRVHQYLRGPIDFYLWALDQGGYIENRFDHRPVHHDAAVVHEAVLALDEESRRLVLYCATSGERPQRCYAKPVPLPLEPSDKYDERGRHIDASGRRREHLIRTAEIVSIPQIEYEMQGRRKLKRARITRWDRYPVKYCPLRWDPEPGFIDLANHLVVVWQAALMLLTRRLAHAEFRAHVIINRGRKPMFECPRAFSDKTISCYHRKGKDVLTEDDRCQGCGWPLYALVEEQGGNMQALAALRGVCPGAGP